jgi:hypothetical protein
MADYRNQPFRFVLGGLDVTHPPELLNDGQLTRALNVRPNIEGAIEARPASGYFVMPQQQLAGYLDSPYPGLWGVGSLRAVRYIGKVTTSAGLVNGYLTIHAATPRMTGYTDPLARVFINGVPVMLKSSQVALSNPAGWPTSATRYGDFIDPTGNSIILANAPNGIPLVIVDGKWWIALKDCNLTAPPVTATSFAIGGPTLPNVPILYAYNLGITAPIAPTKDSTPAGVLTGTYYYAATYKNTKTGFESPLGAIIASSVVLSAQNAVITCTKTTAGAVDQIRLWRKGGAVSNSWRLVGTAVNDGTVGTTNITDNVPDATAALAETIDAELVEIFSTIDSSGAALTGQKFSYCFGPFQGKYLFWVGDPVKKNYVYWNSTDDLGKHNQLNNVNAVSDPAEELLNGFVFGGNPFVFSTKRLYALDYGGPSSTPEFTPREIPIGMGVAGKWACAVGPNAVYICSKDGIYATNCQPDTPVNLTDTTIRPIFRGRPAGDLEAIDYVQSDKIRLYVTNRELHFIYPGQTTQKLFHLVMQLEDGKWFEWTPDRASVVYYNEGQNWNQLIIGTAQDQYLWDFNDSYSNVNETLNVQLRTGSWDSGIPLTHKEFGTLMLDFDPNNVDITITPYYDSEKTAGTSFKTGTANDNAGRRVATYSLDDYYAKSIAFDFQWSESSSTHPKLYQAVLLFREDEEAIVHWEHPEQSLGMAGLFHIKDSYWGLRSTAAVTLTVTTDGITHPPYTLASTAGLRAKVYQELAPFLGKHWGFKLESTAPFRFYGEDSVLFAKPWQTGNTYQPLNPFGTAGYPPYLRKEGGT